MAIVRQLPGKTYAMVYEICGMGCDVSIRFSTVTTDNGLIVMVRNGNRGPWTQLVAPVPVPEAKNNPCPNYSSQLLLLPATNSLLEVALKPDGGTGKPYAATIPLPVHFFNR